MAGRISPGEIQTLYQSGKVITGGNVIQGNYIGTNAAGTAALANGVGLLIDSGASGNTIGGTSAGAGNVISGNSGNGVDLQGSGTTGNVVKANTISQNIGDGVFINGASGNTIGVTGSPNSISNNRGAGVEVSGASASIVGDASTSLTVDAVTTATLATSSVTVNSLTVSYSGISALTTNGNADLNDPSGTLTGLNSLTVTGSTAIEAGTNVTTSGPQTYDNAVTLGANTTLTGSTVTAQSTIAGAGHSLAVNGNAAFDGEATGFSTLSVSGTMDVNTDLVSSSGVQTYTGPVFLMAPVTMFTSTGFGNSGNITFDSTVDGPTALTVNTAGTTTFVGAVGGGSPLAQPDHRPARANRPRRPGANHGQPDHQRSAEADGERHAH